MLQEAIDFREESDALAALLSGLNDEDFARPTQFKGWTVNDVIEHLHVWNWAADTALADEERFLTFIAAIGEHIGAGGTLRSFEGDWNRSHWGGLAGRRLLEAWQGYYPQMADRFRDADPKTRVKWAGPDMSTRSCITARLMETWAHGQEVYDELGVERVNTDRIRAIAFLGVRTFGWTFMVRGLEVPGPAPYVRLTAPSGAVWEFNDPSPVSNVKGDATQFCQVVTQVRNIADTQLTVTGDTATRWMEMAQCFAGAPEAPPAPGTRYTRTA